MHDMDNGGSHENVRLNGGRAASRSWTRRLGVIVSAVSVAAALTTGSVQASTPLQPSLVNAAAAARPAAAPLAATANLAAATQMVSFDAQMITLVNQARAGAKVPALTEAKGLTQLAVWWSSQESAGATGYKLAHNPNAWTMLSQYGAGNRTSWGENVAWSSSSSSTAQQIFTAYMNSPGHKANILKAGYRYIGMGTVSGSHGLFNTTEFTDAVQAGQAGTPVVTPPPVITPAPKFVDGTFIRDTGTGLTYEMVGGAPLAVVSWTPFGGAKSITGLTHAVFLQLPNSPVNGTYLRSIGSGFIFVIAGGAPVFMSEQFIPAAGLKITDVDPAVITNAGQPGIWSHLRAMPADGTFVKTVADGAVYRMAGGAPIWVTSWAPFGGVKPAVVIDPNTLAHAGLSGVWSHLGYRPVDNTYLQGTGSDRIYRVLGGHAAPVLTWASVGGRKAYTVVSAGSIELAGTGGRYNHLR